MSIDNEFVHEEVDIERGSIRENRALWAGILGGPIIWLTQFQVNYMLVPWSCSTGHHWVLHVSSLLFLIAALVPAYLAWKNWRAGGGMRQTDRESARAGRRHFMALLGLLMSSLALLLIIAQAIPSFFLDPCQQ